MCIFCCWRASRTFSTMELFCCFLWVIIYSLCAVAWLLQIYQSWKIPKRNEAAYPSGIFFRVIARHFIYRKVHLNCKSIFQCCNVLTLPFSRLMLTLSLQMSIVCQLLFNQTIFRPHFSLRSVHRLFIFLFTIYIFTRYFCACMILFLFFFGPIWCTSYIYCIQLWD